MAMDRSLTKGRIQIAPSIFSADLSRLADECSRIERYADLIHIDIMDGHFVPEISIGPKVAAAIRQVTKVPLDVHLLVEEPINLISELREAAVDRIAVHYEANDDPLKVIRAIHDSGIEAGIALKGETEFAQVAPIAEEADFILLLTIDPADRSRNFYRDVCNKIYEIQEIYDSTSMPLIEVDGGIDDRSIGALREAGADIFVLGSYFFAAEDLESAVHTLRSDSQPGILNGSTA
jgi:ribulose-phosphate 3-epimerase